MIIIIIANTTDQGHFRKEIETDFKDKTQSESLLRCTETSKTRTKL